MTHFDDETHVRRKKFRGHVHVLVAIGNDTIGVVTELSNDTGRIVPDAAI